MGAADSTSRRGHGVSECCGGSGQVTKGVWRKSQASLYQPAASPSQATRPCYLADEAVGCCIRGCTPIRSFEPPFPLAVFALERWGRNKREIRKTFPSSPPSRAAATASPCTLCSAPPLSQLLLEMASLKGKWVFHCTDSAQTTATMRNHARAPRMHTQRSPNQAEGWEAEGLQKGRFIRQQS